MRKAHAYLAIAGALIGGPTAAQDIAMGTLTECARADSGTPVCRNSLSQKLQIVSEEFFAEYQRRKNAPASFVNLTLADAEREALQQELSQARQELLSIQKQQTIAAATADRARLLAEDAKLKRELSDIGAQGALFARESGTKWTVESHSDKLTGKTKRVLRSMQSDENVLMEVSGECERGVVNLAVLLLDRRGKPTLEIADRIVIVVNDSEPVTSTFSENMGKYSNELILGGLRHGPRIKPQSLYELVAPSLDDRTYRLNVRFFTDQGEPVLQIPTYHSVVRGFSEACANATK